MVKRMATVGSSTRRRGSTRMFSLVQMVSPMAAVVHARDDDDVAGHISA